MKHLMILSLLVFLSQPLWAADKKRIYITDLPFETIESTTSVSEVEIGWLERTTSSTTTKIRTKSYVTDAMTHLMELEECSNYIATVNKTKAQYVFFIEADRDTESRENIVVYDSEDDVIYEGETFRLRNNIKDACNKLNELQ